MRNRTRIRVDLWRVTGRAGRIASRGAVIVLGAMLMVELVVLLGMIGPNLGMDFRFYRDAGQHWLDSGAFYLSRQLAGPYELGLMGDVFYPPTALVLFVPIALLPLPLAALAWWGIPLAILGATSRNWWVWLLVLLWPRALGAFLFGNSDIWAAAAVAAGLRWGWPAVLVLVKPVYAPLAFVGIRHRSWWIGAALLAASVVVMFPLWRDYVMAMLNVRGLGLGYSLGSIPLVIAPLLGRRRQPI